MFLLAAAAPTTSLKMGGPNFCESESVCRDCEGTPGCAVLGWLTATDERACCEGCVDLEACISWTFYHDSHECQLTNASAEVHTLESKCTSGGSAGVGRPHILLITSDQQRTDTVSAYQGDRGVPMSKVASPNFDRLAKEAKTQ